MILGAHTGTEGGLHTVFDQALRDGSNCIQIFSKPSQRWSVPPLSEQEIESFRQARQRAGDLPVLVHDSYLINLASPDPERLERSIEAYAQELKRCADFVGIVNEEFLLVFMVFDGGACSVNRNLFPFSERRQLVCFDPEVLTPPSRE